RKRPRTTLVTLTLPTRSWPPSGVLAWMTNVRWSRPWAVRCRPRSSALTGFHCESRSRDCSTASRYDGRSSSVTVPTQTRSPSARRGAGSGGNPASQHHVRRRGEYADVLARVVLVDHQV